MIKSNMKMVSWLVLIMLVSGGCSVEPEAIEYGVDNCAHCNMTIMDKRYGSEIVTAKGKVFKFDSVECLVDYLKEKKEGSAEAKLLLLTPFNHPGELTDAETCQVLHCRNLPSPMGKYLTAFKDNADGLKFKEDYGGLLYSWEDLLREYDHLTLNIEH